jgi:protocatechuate 3,4-dioxygenase beta subunit
MTLVSGNVLDDAGQPVQGARVFFTQAPVSVPDVAQVTGADGRFSMAAPAPGTYAIEVRAAGGRTRRREIRIGDESVSVTLQL